MAAPDERVCLGVVVGAHGIRGELRIKAFTADPDSIADYGPLETQAGDRKLVILRHRVAKGVVIATVEGIADRNAAEALAGARLYVPRDRLPEPEPDEWYHSDLIGLGVETTTGEPVGTVTAVFDYGAGDLLEVALADRRRVLVPFTRDIVPQVDIKGRRVVIDPPDGLLD